MVRTGLAIGVIAQFALLAVLADRTGLSTLGWLAGVGYGLGVAALLLRGLTRSGAPRLGPANRITLLRATLVGGVCALVADSFVRPPHLTVLVALSTVALVLDAVDGRVARRTGTVSVLGARFDMETDALLILALSIGVARTLGLWVLAIGAARYVYLAAGRLLPWLRESAPPRPWCKVVAATQGIVLTICLSGALPVALSTVAVAAAMALLAESFGRETSWLWRHRGEEPAPAGRDQPDRGIRQESVA